jgi:hypothetical protein
MRPARLTPQEDVEATLIQRDASDLARVLLGVRRHRDAGIFPHTTAALIGLVMEESYRYLSRKPPGSALHIPKPELFSKFAATVTKTRSRLKLFEDTDGYADGLVEALAVAHAKCVEWFAEPHRGFFRSWIRNFQPDLGIYFLGPDLTATTHTTLLGIGMTLGELQSLTPSNLRNLGQRLRTFGEEAGIYLRQLAAFLEAFGKRVELHPEPLPLAGLRLTHNDFIGAKVYRAAVEALQPAEERFVGAVIMVLAQINTAVRLLPKLLAPHSYLLLRMQLLTAYHARNTLEVAVPQLMAEMPRFSDAEHCVLGSRELRNVCAHYGLRHAGGAAVGATDPLGAVIENLVATTTPRLRSLLERWLTAASTILGARLSKPRLAPLRAILGDQS